MRSVFTLLLIAAVVLPHGESGRTQAPAGTNTQVFPTGGPTTTPSDSRGNPVATIAESAQESDWKTWWAYNMERILAARLRGVVISGTRDDAGQESLSRRELRERLFDLFLRAMEDKNQSVRSAAAVALGKIGKPEAASVLERHMDESREGWFTVREASIYAYGILGLPEHRGRLRTIAGNDEQAIRPRGLALVGLAFDGTEESRDLLTWHMRFHHSGFRSTPEKAPVNGEEERRRMAAHLLGFVEVEGSGGGVDELLLSVARGVGKSSPAVQALAVTALGRRHVSDARDALFRLADSRSTDEAVRRSAPIALGRIIPRSDAEGIERLARLVRDQRRDYVAQQFTVMALAEIGGPHALAALTNLLNDNVLVAERDRAFLHLALGLCGPDAADLLVGEYEDARTAAARAPLALACALARAKAAVPLTLANLEKASLSDGADLLAFGSLALGLHADARGVDALREILRKYNEAKVQRGAAIGLALLLRAKAAPELLETLKEAGNVYTKAACVTALGLIPEPLPDVVDSLIAAYRRDSNPDTVRAMALIALGALADPRPVPLSAQLTSHYNYFIRCLALDEIARFL